MTGRRSVWSDPEVLAVAKEFILATDEVWRLQNGKDAECRVFQQMANQGHYRMHTSRTRQGFYVCAADGRFLSSGNSTDPDRILGIIRKGLAAWDELPDKNHRLPAEFRPTHRWEDSFPEDGLVLTMFARDLPAQCDAERPCHNRWNQDPIWFSQNEARQWLPKDLFANSQRHAVPKKLVRRLTRLHLVDTAHGQTSPFSNSQVAGSQLTTELVDRDGDLIRIRITGLTKSNSQRSSWRETPHGVSTQILGQALYDAGQAKFVEFEFVALGQRWGRTPYNNRGEQLDASPIGFVVQLADEDAAKIAPAFVGEYDVDWVQHPKRGFWK